MKRLIASLAALAVVAAFAAPVAAQTAAAPFTGKWDGNISMGGQDQGQAQLNLTQKGKVLTGTAGPGAQQQWPIAKGVVTGAKATFEVQQPNGPLFKFTATIVKGHLMADAVVTGPNGQTQNAKIDATKAAPAAKK